MFIQLLLCVVIGFVRETKELTRGRDAKPGEFPFVVRIRILEELEQDDNEDHDHDHGHGDDEHEYGTVAGGVLITLSRVLTTCDSVGFFAGQKVNLYNCQKVNVMAGSVKHNGEGGQFRVPSRSSVHPFCYFLTSTMKVLFNYGVYEFDQPFDRLMIKGTNIPLIAPVKHAFKSMDEMHTTLRGMRKGYENMECFAAGWGNYKKEFEGRGMPDHFQRFSSTLQTIPMKIVDYPECNESTCKYFDECLLSIWESGYVCAKSAKGGPCNEDNGAPLICAGQVFAILIHPRRCTNTGYPRHFLRVDLAFKYVFDIQSRSNVNAVTGYTLLGALLIPSWLKISSVVH